MENNNELNPKESLKIINEMIETAKGSIKEHAFYFILWGWVVIICSFLHYMFMKFSVIEKSYRVWSLAVIGVIVTVIYSIKQGKQEKMFTHLNKINTFVWISFFVNYIIFVLFIKEFNYKISALIFLMVGNSTFLTGIIIKFKPLIYGGILYWISCILFLNISYEYILILTPVIVAIGNLIPGYILRKK